MPHYDDCDSTGFIGFTWEDVDNIPILYKEVKKILYIHGYGSSKNSSTGKKLAQYLPKVDVITETFSTNPYEAIEQANKLMSEHNIDLVVASSFGAFAALHVKDKPKLLINPCLFPSEQILKRHPEFRGGPQNLYSVLRCKKHIGGPCDVKCQTYPLLSGV